MAPAYFSFDRFFLGWLASERFFRHLPDFVLSRSLDHLPFFTVGAGIDLTQVSVIMACSQAREMFSKFDISLFS
jgi:hypothetical protein